MCNANLSDANWALIFAFLKTQSNLYIGSCLVPDDYVDFF